MNPLNVDSTEMEVLQPITPEDYPINEDLSDFEVPFYPHEFTPEEQALMAPFFTNLDQPVFVIQNLPSEIIGALCSRYSRAEGGIRKVFLEEYINPILYPEKHPNWNSLSEEQQAESESVRARLYEYIAFWHTNGGLDDVVNLQRARKFYHTWLSQFGDDSIAEMGTSVSLCIEGISNLAVNAIQSQRIGVSSLEKSSRYVFFGDKNPDGSYKFSVPGEIKGTGLEAEYIETMTLLFDTYVNLLPIHLERIKELYPRDEGENDASFRKDRMAKVFDDLRELLPFCTQTSLGLNISGRAAEQLINRLLSDQNGEVRWWGQQIAAELQKVIPSFIERAVTKRGAEQQIYRRSQRLLAREMAEDLDVESDILPINPSVSLISYTADPDVEILARHEYEGAKNKSLIKVRNKIKDKTPEERHNLLGKILKKRDLGEKETERKNVRFRKPPRAFEVPKFDFEVICRLGAARDLWRHRMLTHGRPLITTDLGYDLEPDLLQAPYIEDIKKVFEQVDSLYRKIAEINPDTAQYVVPFGFLQRFYWTISAREIYWLVELRTGQQGHPHYRKIAQMLATEVMKVAPSVFQDMRTDYNEYGLARREPAKKKNLK